MSPARSPSKPRSPAGSLRPPTPSGADEPCVWVLKTSSAGDTNNRLAIARAIAPHHHRLVSPKDVRHDVEQMALAYTGAARLDQVTNWPDIFLICEQETSKYGRGIKELSAGHTFVVGMQTPDIDNNDFDNNVGDYTDYQTDMQVVWSHLKTAAPTPQARNHGLFRHQADTLPSPITPELLSDAADKAPASLQQLRGKRPIYAVLIGGLIDSEHRFHHSNWYDYADEKQLVRDNLTALIDQVAAQAAKDNGAVVVTTSHRSPHQFSALISDRLTAVPHVFYDWSQKRGSQNPYHAMLALADQIVVTSDSLSMTADALATGKPVFSFLAQEKRAGEQPRKLPARLRQTAMIKPETACYLSAQAAQGRGFPMAQLGNRRLKIPPRVDGAKTIAEAITQAHGAYRYERAAPRQTIGTPMAPRRSTTRP